MERDILETAGQIAGLGGLALGVLLLVFRQIIAKAIFPTLTKGHAYRLLRLMTVLVFVVAIVGMGAWVYVETPTEGGSTGPIETRGNGSPVVVDTNGDVSITIGEDPERNDEGQPP
jgi:hypothetical protein